MKVADLIKELSKHPGDLEVITEGCDCTGEIEEVYLRNWVDNDDHQNIVVFLGRS